MGVLCIILSNISLRVKLLYQNKKIFWDKKIYSLLPIKNILFFFFFTKTQGEGFKYQHAEPKSPINLALTSLYWQMMN